MSKSMHMHQKEVDDVLGGADAWKNVQKTEGVWHFPSLCFKLTHLS